jgi:hypothetical protein
MSDNTVTLVVNGEVSLDIFNKALSAFTELIEALSEEAGAHLDWIVQDLQVSSAMVSSMSKGDLNQVKSVVVGYEDVSACLEQDKPINHAKRVQQAASNLVTLPDRRVPSLLMQTAAKDSIVPNRPERAGLALVPRPQPDAARKPLTRPTIMPAYGAIEGRIQTLTSRGGLRFTLYDLLYDKAVSCYVTDENKELLRGMWGRLVIVEGLIARDPDNARPISIREIKQILSLQESAPRDYEAARGAAPSLNKLSPEEAIRRIRDAQ